MKKEHTHIIKTQQYEIAIRNESEAHIYQSKISRLQEYTINPIFQKIMDTYHLPEYLDVYEEISLDIGTVSAVNFEKELEYKIEEAFSNFFKNNTLTPGNLKKGKRKNIYNKQLDQFNYFITNGHFSWDVNPTTKPIDLFQVLLKNNKKQLILSLKKHGKKERIRKRLITLLHDDFLDQIVLVVAVDEGAHIIKQRENIVDHQKSNSFVATNTNNFRDAIWEITLAYIFLESKSYYNQKTYLQYVLRKVAQKYRFTYHKLINTIVSTIQDNPSYNNTFEKLLLELKDEETQISEITINKNTNQNYIDLFKYYLQYNSLPADTTFYSIKEFYSHIEKTLPHATSDFFNFFYKLIQNHTNIEQLIVQIPDKILNIIVQRSQSSVFAKLNTFLKEISIISSQLQLQSKTHTALHTSYGKIALFSYATTNKIVSKNRLVEFLFQLIKRLEIDNNFISILETYKNNTNNSEVSSFIEELVFQKKLPKLVTTDTQNNQTTFLELTEKMYSHYRLKNKKSLHNFREQLLQETHYSEDGLKLTLLLIKLNTNKDHYSIQEINHWIEQRYAELLKKGKKVVYISNYIMHTINLLSLNKTFTKNIIAILEKYVQNTPPISFSKKTNQKTKLSENIYDSLIKNIQQLLQKYSGKDLVSNTKQVIEQFALYHKISVNLVVLELQKKTSGKTHLQITNRIIQDLIITTKTKQDDSKYKIDLVAYFITRGAFPWWAKNTSIEVVQIYLAEILKNNPKQFYHWYSSSKYQVTTLQILPDNVFETFIKYLNSSISSDIFMLINMFQNITLQELSSIRTISIKQVHEIRVPILSYITTHQTIQTLPFTNFLIKKLSSVLKLKKNDIQLLVIQQLSNQKNSKSIEKLAISLASKNKEIIPSPIQKLEHYWSDWKNIHAYTAEEQIFSILKSTYNQQPNILISELKKGVFRHKIIQKLNPTLHVALIHLLINESKKVQFSILLNSIQSLQKEISKQEYKSLWGNFINTIILKIVLETKQKWAIQDWSYILYKSITKNQVAITTIEKALTTKENKNNDIIKMTNELLVKQANDIEFLEKKITPYIKEPEEINEEDSIYISNSGMVLLAPYIPMLFERAGLLKNNTFKDIASTHKAIHLLQYTVTGKVAIEEHELILNKIICGLPTYETISKDSIITNDDIELVEGMLKAVIAHWSILKNTSIDGLRETFLYRDGQINAEEEKYILTVEQKTFDMLLDQIPWSIGQLKLSWMQKLIEVIWR